MPSGSSERSFFIVHLWVFPKAHLMATGFYNHVLNAAAHRFYRHELSAQHVCAAGPGHRRVTPPRTASSKALSMGLWHLWPSNGALSGRWPRCRPPLQSLYRPQKTNMAVGIHKSRHYIHSFGVNQLCRIKVSLWRFCPTLDILPFSISTNPRRGFLLHCKNLSTLN